MAESDSALEDLQEGLQNYFSAGTSDSKDSFAKVDPENSATAAKDLEPHGYKIDEDAILLRRSDFAELRASFLTFDEAFDAYAARDAAARKKIQKAPASDEDEPPARISDKLAPLQRSRAIKKSGSIFFVPRLPVEGLAEDAAQRLREAKAEADRCFDEIGAGAGAPTGAREEQARRSVAGTGEEIGAGGTRADERGSGLSMSRRQAVGQQPVAVRRAEILRRFFDTASRVVNNMHAEMQRRGLESVERRSSFFGNKSEAGLAIDASDFRAVAEVINRTKSLHDSLAQDAIDALLHEMACAVRREIEAKFSLQPNTLTEMVRLTTCASGSGPRESNPESSGLDLPPASYPVYGPQSLCYGPRISLPCVFKHNTIGEGSEPSAASFEEWDYENAKSYYHAFCASSREKHKEEIRLLSRILGDPNVTTVVKDTLHKFENNAADLPFLRNLVQSVPYWSNCDCDPGFDLEAEKEGIEERAYDLAQILWLDVCMDEKLHADAKVLLSLPKSSDSFVSLFTDQHENYYEVDFGRVTFFCSDTMQEDPEGDGRTNPEVLKLNFGKATWCDVVDAVFRYRSRHGESLEDPILFTVGQVPKQE
eukprot:g12789.t1